jgi:hypothetical protein
MNSLQLMGSLTRQDSGLRADGGTHDGHDGTMDTMKEGLEIETPHHTFHRVHRAHRVHRDCAAGAVITP